MFVQKANTAKYSWLKILQLIDQWVKKQTRI